MPNEKVARAMQDQDSDSGRGRQPGRTSTGPTSWREAYPVLLGCVSEGRSPSGEEIERLVARMGREIGAGANSVWNGAGSASVRRRLLLAAASAALLGRRDPLSPHPQFPLVLRGH